MKIFTQTILLIISALILNFCTGKKKNESVALSEQTHGKYAKPDYSIVFPNDKVNRIDIKIDTKNWNRMQADLKTNTGEIHRRMPPPDKDQNSFFGNNCERRPIGGPPLTGQKTGSQSNHVHRQMGRMGPPPEVHPGDSKKKPIWEPCNVYFNNQEWSKVGIRFKGNSSLHFAAEMGIQKLSFKLDFDEFENEYPETKDQRFYGFKQLNLKNNFLDASFIREKVASDLFREFGIVSPQTAFYQVYVDFGEGEKYFGLYTMVEEVDDTVLKSNYTQSDGNLYKPERMEGTFSADSFHKQEFNKKSNKKDNDYSDVQQLHKVINSSKRTTDYPEWRNDLETIFDVPVFLKWLAANTVIQNWDTYGKMSHNYYLYYNQETGKLEWIPWDNNEAFQEAKKGKALSLSLDEVDESWPLIRYLIDIPEYREKYEGYLQQFVDEVFIPDGMKSLYTYYYEILKEYAYSEEDGYTFVGSNAQFDRAIQTLKNHVQQRYDAVSCYLK